MLHRAVTEIRRSMDLSGTRIRLMGVSVSNLETEDTGERQLEFMF
jgi:nucleotidyltransferase/DNA polymerase involved in DNA repair